MKADNCPSCGGRGEIDEDYFCLECNVKSHPEQIGSLAIQCGPHGELDVVASNATNETGTP